MSRILERMNEDGFSDPMEYMDQPGRKANRKSSVMDNYDDDEDDMDEDDMDDEDEDEEEFEEDDDDE